MKNEHEKLSPRQGQNLMILATTTAIPCLAIVGASLIAREPKGIAYTIPYAFLHLLVWAPALPAFRSLPVMSWLLWTFLAPGVILAVMVLSTTGFDGFDGWGWFFVTGLYAEAWWIILPVYATCSSITLWLTSKDRTHGQPLEGNHIITRIAYKLFG